MSLRYDAIYLSPHLDDAALSCGGRVAQECAAGDDVLVVTVAAADEPEELSDLARRLHGYWGLERGVAAARREEDAAACHILGAGLLHWDVQECVYRRHPETGDFLYTTFESLFGPVHAAEDELVEEVAARVAALPRHGRLYAPLGVGGHVDHLLVRRAAERARVELAYYEDYPYVERWRALGKALGRKQDWRSKVVALEKEDLATKCEAVAAYASQIPTLFKNRRRMERRLRRRARWVGGERYWQRKGAPLAAP